MNITKEEIHSITLFTSENLDIENFKLDDEFFYQSLPLCVIDAIFSIGVRYESVKKAVSNFCNYKQIQSFRNDRKTLPETENQYSVNQFLADFGGLDGESLAKDVFKNKQRTSSRSGILKAEAIVEFLKVLQNYEVNYFQDLSKLNKSFDDDIKQIKGQSSGIALQYFYMLAGNDDLIKPDRMVIRYLEKILDKKVSLSDAQDIIVKVSSELENSFSIIISPRELDNIIWNYQREQN